MKVLICTARKAKSFKIRNKTLLQDDMLLKPLPAKGELCRYVSKWKTKSDLHYLVLPKGQPSQLRSTTSGSTLHRNEVYFFGLGLCVVISFWSLRNEKECRKTCQDSGVLEWLWWWGCVWNDNHPEHFLYLRQWTNSTFHGLCPVINNLRKSYYHLHLIKKTQTEKG